MADFYEHESVVYETRCEGRVALVTLNRPERLNAYTGAMGAALVSAYERANADPEVRCLVLTGAGKGFCAGADMAGLAATGDGKSAAQGGKSSAAPPPVDQDFILAPTRISKPVIAAINGACAGLGLSIALGADIRFAAAGAKFTAAFPKRGLIAEHGVSWALPHLVGTGNAMLFLMSGEVFVAEECHHMGLVQRVFPKERLLEETMRFAESMAVNIPISSNAVIKQQVLHHPQLTREAALEESNRLMAASANPRNPDFKEGVKSFQEKRAPLFDKYDASRLVIQQAREMFGPKGAKL